MVDGKPVVGRVGNLINNDPLTLWNATRTQGVNLTRDAHHALKAKLSILFPNVAIANEEKKQQLMATRRVKRKLAKQQI